MSDTIYRADAKPTVIQSKTLFPTKDFIEWAKRIKEVNPNAVVIPCDAEVASAEVDWKRRVMMYLADLQLSCDPHTKIGKAKWEALETAFQGIADMLSAEAEQGYTEWLEKIIVMLEPEYLCEDTTDKEWCEENCHYSSIQVECLRHLYEVSKGGDDE